MSEVGYETEGFYWDLFFRQTEWTERSNNQKLKIYDATDIVPSFGNQ